MHAYVSRIVVIGFRPVEFQRIQIQTADLLIELVDGGCIENQSNAQQRALSASDRCDLVVWRPKYARKLPAGFVGTHAVRFVNGVSAAVRELDSYASSRVAA